MHVGSRPVDTQWQASRALILRTQRQVRMSMACSWWGFPGEYIEYVNYARNKDRVHTRSRIPMPPARRGVDADRNAILRLQPRQRIIAMPFFRNYFYASFVIPMSTISTFRYLPPTTWMSRPLSPSSTISAQQKQCPQLLPLSSNPEPDYRATRSMVIRGPA